MSLKQQLRPNALFETFIPQTELQSTVATNMQSLAISFVEKKGILNNAKFIAITGSTGRGKSHLIEAFLHIILNSKKINENVIYLARGKYVYQGMKNACSGKQLVVIDDLYSDCQDLNSVPDFMLEPFMDAILEMYENRTLVILNTNFSMRGLLEKISKIDKIGRITSRLQEIGITNIEMDGPDYRNIIKEQRADDPWKL